MTVLDPADLGAAVGRTRTARGWSQERLASIAGVGRQTVIRLERGEEITTAKLKSIAAALELQVVLRPHRQSRSSSRVPS